MMAGSINMPDRWPGDDDDAQRNVRTHMWSNYRCAICDCRGSDVSAEWPCGIEPTRTSYTDPDTPPLSAYANRFAARRMGLD